MNMLFNSYIFIIFFLPAALGGFYILKTSKKYSLAKVFLVCMSLWFYGYFNTFYLFIITGSVLVNYAIYRLISRFKKNKILLVTGVLFNTGLLFYFKYFNFFIDNINHIFKTNFLFDTILMPLGISFFTFQQISFIVDTYKSEVPLYNFIDYALFVTFFPQLIAGPIVSHNEMMPQILSIDKHKFDIKIFCQGVLLFIIGLSKKVLIADVFGGAVDWGYTNYSLLTSENLLLLMFLYPFQLYFDFSGYCDMAVGLGKMFMINLPANFGSPYKSENVVDFWRRWHITLGSFLTKYIYIPLGGSQKGKIRQFINILIVFFVSGIWHGAGWTYITWGLLHGVFQILTRLLTPIIKKMPKFFNVATQFTITSFLFFFFRAESLEKALSIIKRLFAFEKSMFSLEIASFFAKPELIMILKILHANNLWFSGYILMIFFLIISFIIVFLSPNSHEIICTYKFKCSSAIVFGLLAVWSIISLSQVSTFLYFNF